MGKNNKEYVGTGKGMGYYGSSDIYKNGEKIASEAYRTTLTGKPYTDVYDKHGNKVDSHY